MTSASSGLGAWSSQPPPPWRDFGINLILVAYSSQISNVWRCCYNGRLYTWTCLILIYRQPNYSETIQYKLGATLKKSPSFVAGRYQQQLHPHPENRFLLTHEELSRSISKIKSQVSAIVYIPIDCMIVCPWLIRDPNRFGREVIVTLLKNLTMFQEKIVLLYLLVGFEMEQILGVKEQMWDMSMRLHWSVILLSCHCQIKRKPGNVSSSKFTSFFFIIVFFPFIGKLNSTLVPWKYLLEA